MVNLHVQYRQGLLAVSGGVLDQPNAYMESMTLISDVYAEYDMEQ